MASHSIGDSPNAHLAALQHRVFVAWTHGAGMRAGYRLEAHRPIVHEKHWRIKAGAVANSSLAAAVNFILSVDWYIGRRSPAIPARA
jgi:hypothetical protein